MAGKITYLGRDMTKAEVVAEVANQFISELKERSSRNGEVRDYYDIAVVGYSGRGVSSLLPGKVPFMPIVELVNMPACEQSSRVGYTMADGGTKYYTELTKCWIEPEASGLTPMFEALIVVRDLIDQWCAMPENSDSYPPFLINITDGESSDCEYKDIDIISNRIKSISTNDGEVLFINVHIASLCDSTSIIFPSDEDLTHEVMSNRRAMSLYQASSYMPDSFNDVICDIKGIRPSAISRFKGVGFNSSITELVSILNIGSISVKIS